MTLLIVDPSKIKVAIGRIGYDEFSVVNDKFQLHNNFFIPKREKQLSLHMKFDHDKIKIPPNIIYYLSWIYMQQEREREKKNIEQHNCNISCQKDLFSCISK